MNRKVKHGLAGSKEYQCWMGMKSRCYNKEAPSYHKYGAIGIEVDSTFVNDFTAFIAEVGMMPDTVNRWTIDRINGSLGYLRGNIRWATASQQTRNRRMQRNNESGVTGVYWTLGVSGITYAMSSWYEMIDGKLKQKHKSFNTTKLGLMPAFSKAVEHRLIEIDRLNHNGYGYSDLHGKTTT